MESTREHSDTHQNQRDPSRVGQTRDGLSDASEHARRALTASHIRQQQVTRIEAAVERSVSDVVRPPSVFDGILTVTLTVLFFAWVFCVALGSIVLTFLNIVPSTPLTFVLTVAIAIGGYYPLVALLLWTLEYGQSLIRPASTQAP